MKSLLNKFKNKLKKGALFIKRSSRNFLAVIIGIIISGIIISVTSLTIGWFWLKDHQEKSPDSNFLRYAESFYNDNKIHKTSFKKLTLQLTKENILKIKANIDIKPNSTNNTFLKAENITISVAVNDFFKHLSLPIEIDIKNAHINLNNVPHSQSINTKYDDERPITLKKSYNNFAGYFGGSKLLHIKKLDVSRSKITRDETEYQLTQKTAFSGESFLLNSELKSKAGVTNINSEIHHKNKHSHTKFEIKNLPTWFLIYAISDDYFHQISPVLDSKSSINATLKIESTKFSKAPYISIDLESNNISESNILNKFKISAETLKQGTLTFNEVNLVTANSGSIKASGALKISDKTISLEKLKVTGQNILVDHLKYLWPNTQLEASQKWVATNLSKGTCGFKFDFDNKNLKHKTFKIGKIDFTGLNMNYSPKFDPITNITGDLEIYSDYLIINLNEGKIRDASVLNSSATIAYSKQEIPLVIKVKSEGEFKNYQKFLEESFLSQKKDILDISNTRGKVEAIVDINIPLGSTTAEDQIVIEVDSTLKDLQTYLFKDTKVESELLKIKIKNGLTTLNGKALFNELLCDINVIHNTENQDEFITKTELSTNIDSMKFVNENIAKQFDIKNGNVPSTFTHTIEKNKETLTGKLDTNTANIYLSDIGFTTAENDNSSLLFEFTNEGDTSWKTKYFTFRSNDIDAKFNIEISKNFDKITQLESDLSYNNNNLKLKYLTENDKNIIKIYGNEFNLDSIHLPNLMNLFSGSDETTSQNNKGGRILWSIQLDKLLMKNGIFFEDVVGHLDCTKHNCVNSGFSMKINQNDFLQIYLNRDQVPNTWVFRTNNAASCLKGLGLYQDIEGGLLEGEVKYVHNTIDKNSLPSMVGNVHVENFNALKTPVITKLIMLSPFSAIKNLEKSSLIPFDQMDLSFVLANQKLEINRSYATGKMVSVKLDGSIDRKKDQMNIKGRVIPKSKINTALASLKGNKADMIDKEGLIGNDFKIVGHLNEPSVNMNPIGAAVSLLLRLTPIGLF